MRHLTMAFCATALCAVVLLPAVHADVLDLADGQRIPKELQTPWGEIPTDTELRETARARLELSFTNVALGRATRVDAAQVHDIYVSAANENESFRYGETNGASGFWEEAAEAFGLAATELDGAAKEVALFKRMLALANTQDATRTLQACDEYLVAFPRGYYFGAVQETRARIFARQNKTEEAVAALQAVTAAEGMNVRDYFNAEYFRVWLTQFVVATTPETTQEAATSFQRVLDAIRNHPRRQLASKPRLKALMSLASCLRSLGQMSEARTHLDEVLSEANRATDQDVLAGAYYVLGDVAYEEASRLQEQAGGDPQKKEAVVAALEQSALHYLRVLLLYRDWAGAREVFGATQGAARVFNRLFVMSEETDCALARRAYDFYFQAVQMQERGEARRELVKEARSLKSRIDVVCGGDGQEGSGGTEGSE